MWREGDAGRTENDIYDKQSKYKETQKLEKTKQTICDMGFTEMFHLVPIDSTADTHMLVVGFRENNKQMTSYGKGLYLARQPRPEGI